MRMTVMPIVIGVLRTIPKGLVKGLEIKRISGKRPNYSFIKIGQNTEKSPGVENHQLTLVWKTFKGVK